MTKEHSLSRQVETLKNQRDLLLLEQRRLYDKTEHLHNSMSALVGAAFGQSELTSFNPIAQNNVYAPLTLNWMQLTYLYKTHGIIQAAIDMPVEDALTGGIEITSDELDKDDLDRLQDSMAKNETLRVGKQAEIWAKLYGGGGIIVNAGDPEKPLVLNHKTLRDMKLYAANRWELISPQRFSEYYNFYNERIHASHVFTMAGKEAPYIIRWILQGWGMSDVEHIVEPLNIFLRTQNVIYDLLKEAKVDVYQFEHFASSLSSNKGTQQMLRRVQVSNQAKSTGNAILMDMKDKYEQKQLSFAGLAEMWRENRIGLACSLRIPMTKLFGISAAGFNSGEDDRENYIGMIDAQIREHMRPTIQYLLDLEMIRVFGEQYDIHFKFKPLRVMSAAEEETIKSSKHNRLLALAQGGYLTPQEFMEIEQAEGLVPMQTEVASGADPYQTQEKFEQQEAFRGEAGRREKSDDKTEEEVAHED
jgi:uncharacterized protein